MTTTEFEILVKGIKNAYPNSRFLEDTDSKKMWYQFLKELDYKVAGASVARHIKTNKFPPSIAEIRAEVDKKNKFNNFLPRGYDMDKLENALLAVEMRGYEDKYKIEVK